MKQKQKAEALKGLIVTLLQAPSETKKKKKKDQSEIEKASEDKD